MEPQLLAIHTQRPPWPPGLVERPHLVEAVERALTESRVVLIAAPAGFGKTTLLTEWAHRTARPVAWLTIESERCDAERFMRYLVMAWSAIDPTLLASPAGSLAGAKQPDLDLAFRALANHALLSGEPETFVIDDLHLLHDPEARRHLILLIDHLPPAFRFLLASRGMPALPLARFRVQHHLTEIGADRLAFSVDESRQLLGTDLNLETVVAAQEWTEGWVAALRLLARSGAAPALVATPAIGAYLAEEVLSGLDAETRDKLLALGIVDRVCPSLGDAILGESGSAAILDRLAREQLFVQPLDEVRRWYRFHPLLLERLRVELLARPDIDARLLHGRAARWLLTEGMIDDAFRHAVAGEDPRLLIEIVEPRVVMMLEAGDFHTVRSWIDRVPETWYAIYPELNFLRVAYLIFAGEIELSARIIDDIEHRLAAEPGSHDRLIAKLEAVRCAIACVLDKIPAAERHAARAFDGLDAADVTMRANTHHALADIYRRHGRWDDARRHYHEILELSPADPASELRLVHVHGALADLELRRGTLREAAARWQLAIAAMQRQENWGRVAIPLTGWAFIRHGELLYEWNALPEAEAALARGLERAELGGDVRAMIAGHLLATRLRIARGALAEAAVSLGRARELSERVSFPEWTSQVDRVSVLLWVAENDAVAARAWRRAAEGPSGLNARTDAHDAWLALAHLLIVFGGPAELDRARTVLDVQLVQAERDGRLMVAVEALALLALASAQGGDTDAARVQLSRALTLAEPEEPVRRLLDLGGGFHDLLRQIGDQGALSAYGSHLLDACAGGQAPAVTPAGPLSDRELEILRLVGVGLTNRETAERLFISPETVKRHLANIYDKLDAHRRTEALVRARELGLIA